MWAQGKRGCRLADWRRVHWSDECSFQLMKRNGRVRVWRQTGERFRQDCIVPTFASGRISVTVWGCVSNDCKLDLVDIRGNLNAQRYVDEILPPPHVEPHMDNHRLMDRPIYMHDGATPHTAHLSQDYLHRAAVDVMLWPSMSPDLNIMENIWSYMSSHINGAAVLPRSAEQLRRAVHDAWLEVSQARIRRLVASLRRRFVAVINARGGPTRYWKTRKTTSAVLLHIP